MKVLVVGGGGREHAIIQKLKESKEITALYCAAGQRRHRARTPSACPSRPRMWRPSRTGLPRKRWITRSSPRTIRCAWALVDLLAARGIPCFRARQGRGPHRGQQGLCQGPDAANTASPPRAMRPLTTRRRRLPMCARRRVPWWSRPTDWRWARAYSSARRNAQAEAAVDRNDGKRQVRCQRQPRGGGGVPGGARRCPFCASPTATAIRPMVSSMDHKRALDGDRGLNTGGMGAIAPNPCYTPEVAAALHGGDLPAHAGRHARGGLPLPRAVCTSG